MARSFLTSVDPAFNQALVNSMHVGAQLATEVSKQESENALTLQREKLQRDAQIKINEATQAGENARNKLLRTEQIIKDSAGLHKDYIDKTSDYLANHGGELTPHARTVLEASITQHRFDMGSLYKSFSDTLGVNMPNPGQISTLDQADAAFALTDYDPAYTKKLDADRRKSVYEADNAERGATANALVSLGVQIGSPGTIATPQEAISWENSQRSASQGAQRLDIQERGLGLRQNGLKNSTGMIGVDGKPIMDNSELYHLLHSQDALPQAKPKINELINSWRAETKDLSADSPSDAKLKAAADKKLNDSLAPYQSDYKAVSDFYFNNADDKIRTKIRKLGLGLRPETLISDNNIIAKAIGDTSNTADDQAVIGHIYSGLGFGKLQNVPEYKPTPRLIPSSTPLAPGNYGDPNEFLNQ